MTYQIINEEFRRMQELAGLLKEEKKLTFGNVIASVPPALEKLGYKDDSFDDYRRFMFEYEKEVPSNDLNGVAETASFRVLVSIREKENKPSLFSEDKIFAEIYFKYDEELKRVGVEVYDLRNFSNIQQLTNEILNLVKKGEDMVYKTLDFSDENMIEKDMVS